jgi:hypothetical protein
MPNISIDWKLASALVPVSSESSTIVKALKRPASTTFHRYYKGGGYEIWMTRHRVDPNVVDVAFGKFLFHTVCSNVKSAIEMLSIDRASARSVEVHVTAQAGFTRASDVTIGRLKNGGYSLSFSPSSSLSDGQKWKNDKSKCELVIGAMNLLNSECHCYSPGTIDGMPSEFVFNRGEFDGHHNQIVGYRMGERIVNSSFADEQFRIPDGLTFFCDTHTSDQILHLCERLCDYFGSTPQDILVFDTPSEENRENPLSPPEGVWNCAIWGEYKKGFDPFKRPKHPFEGSVRYPIWRKQSDDFSKLLWQIDIVHTETDSFFDVQTSEGHEYLQQFLDENKLQGKIWQGDFTERWNFPMPKQVETPREDARYNQEFMNSQGLTSSLDQSQIETAEGWVQILKERSKIELDYTADSLRVLDDYITKYFPEGCMFNTTIESVAAYIGEVLRRECGAEWVMSEKYPPGVAVDGLFANVHGWTENRFDPKQTDTLVEKYDRYRAEMEKRKGTQLPT